MIHHRDFQHIKGKKFDRKHCHHSSLWGEIEISIEKYKGIIYLNSLPHFPALSLLCLAMDVKPEYPWRVILDQSWSGMHQTLLIEDYSGHQVLLTQEREV